jgi:hypothetical protein
MASEAVHDDNRARGKGQAGGSLCPIGEHGGQDGDHLAIAILGFGELASNPLESRRQHPILERSAVAQGSGLTGQDRNIAPGIVDCLAATVVAGMLHHDAPVLADHDALGVGVNVDWTTDCAGAHRVFIVVEPRQARLRHRCLLHMEPVEATAIGDELGPLFLKHLPYGLLGAFGGCGWALA